MSCLAAIRQMWPLSCLLCGKSTNNRRTASKEYDVTEVNGDNLTSNTVSGTQPWQPTTLTTEYGRSLFPVACVSFEDGSGDRAASGQLLVLWHNSDALELWERLIDHITSQQLAEVVADMLHRGGPSSQVVMVPGSCFSIPAVPRHSSLAVSVPVHVSLGSFAADTPESPLRRTALIVCKVPLLARFQNEGIPLRPAASQNTAHLASHGCSGSAQEGGYSPGTEPLAVLGNLRNGLGLGSGEQPPHPYPHPYQQQHHHHHPEEGREEERGDLGTELAAANAAYRQRDSMVAAYLPAVITVFTLEGRVLHQNPASQQYLGPMPTTRFTAARAPLVAGGPDGGGVGGDDSGGVDGESEPGWEVLGHVFQYEQVKLRQMMEVLELAGPGSVWQGIVRVPLSSVLRESLCYPNSAGLSLTSGPGAATYSPGRPPTVDASRDLLAQPLAGSGDQQDLGPQPQPQPPDHPKSEPGGHCTMRPLGHLLSRALQLPQLSPPHSPSQSQQPDTHQAPTSPVAQSPFRPSRQLPEDLPGSSPAPGSRPQGPTRSPSQPLTTQREQHPQPQPQPHPQPHHPPRALSQQLVEPRAPGSGGRAGDSQRALPGGLGPGRPQPQADTSRQGAGSVQEGPSGTVAALRAHRLAAPQTADGADALGRPGAAGPGSPSTREHPQLHVEPGGSRAAMRVSNWPHDRDEDPLATSTWTLIADRPTVRAASVPRAGGILRPRPRTHHTTQSAGADTDGSFGGPRGSSGAVALGLTRRWGSATQADAALSRRRREQQQLLLVASRSDSHCSKGSASARHPKSPNPGDLARQPAPAGAAAASAVVRGSSGPPSTGAAAAGGPALASAGGSRASVDGGLQWGVAGPRDSGGQWLAGPSSSRGGGSVGSGATGLADRALRGVEGSRRAVPVAGTEGSAARAAWTGRTGRASLDVVGHYRPAGSTAPSLSRMSCRGGAVEGLALPEGDGDGCGSGSALSRNSGSRRGENVSRMLLFASSLPSAPFTPAAASAGAGSSSVGAGGGSGPLGGSAGTAPAGPSHATPPAAVLTSRAPAPTSQGVPTSHRAEPSPRPAPASVQGPGTGPGTGPEPGATSPTELAAQVLSSPPACTASVDPPRTPLAQSALLSPAGEASALVALMLARRTGISRGASANRRAAHAPAVSETSSRQGTGTGGTGTNTDRIALPTFMQSASGSRPGREGGETLANLETLLESETGLVRRSPPGHGGAGGLRSGDRQAFPPERLQELPGGLRDALSGLEDRPYDTWHEISAVRALDPVTGASVVVVTQVDVTAKVRAERHLVHVMCAERRLLLQLFPRHVLQHVMDANPLLNSEAATLGALPREWLDGGDWRPVLRDCDKLATMHPQATVLFADIAGFDDICMELPPQKVLAFLNDLFAKFDNSIEPFGVHKMETIGGLFIVAGGLLREEEDGAVAVRDRWDPLHAEKVFFFAKAMMNVAAKTTLPTTAQEPVKLRIGIHTGPVMSGIVGTRVPRFVLFGDTVNTASRMQTTCTPGSVHVSEDTQALLRHENWTPTGGVEIKGKGLLNTYVWVPEEAIQFLIPPHSSNRDSSAATTATTAAQALSTMQQIAHLETSCTSSEFHLAQQLSFTVPHPMRGKSRLRHEGYL